MKTTKHNQVKKILKEKYTNITDEKIDLIILDVLNSTKKPKRKIFAYTKTQIFFLIIAGTLGAMFFNLLKYFYALLVKWIITG